MSQQEPGEPYQMQFLNHQPIQVFRWREHSKVDAEAQSRNALKPSLILLCHLEIFPLLQRFPEGFSPKRFQNDIGLHPGGISRIDNYGAQHCAVRCKLTFHLTSMGYYNEISSFLCNFGSISVLSNTSTRSDTVQALEYQRPVLKKLVPLP